MYELCNLSGNTYYINCPAKIGLYVDGSNVILIDSGNDKDTGKKVKRIIEENNWSLKTIINTHSHADHIGGNKFLQEWSGCRVFSKGIECSFTLSPILEPSFLYGSFPHKELLHKFLYAKESTCEDIVQAQLPEGFEIIDLPGHSFEMIGIRTPDNVLFVADSINSIHTLEKYGIGFIYNVEEYLKTLDILSDIKADIFVPSHADVSTDISEIINFNRFSVLSVCDFITDSLFVKKTFEDLLANVFDKYNLTMTNEQYVLIGSAVKSYLTFLKESEKVSSFFEGNRQYWKTIE